MFEILVTASRRQASLDGQLSILKTAPGAGRPLGPEVGDATANVGVGATVPAADGESRFPVGVGIGGPPDPPQAASAIASAQPARATPRPRRDAIRSVVEAALIGIS
jgi:hypothetical protein